MRWRQRLASGGKVVEDWYHNRKEQKGPKQKKTAGQIPGSSEVQFLLFDIFVGCWLAVAFDGLIGNLWAKIIYLFKMLVKFSKLILT